jgi:hypothetical protein
MILMPDMARLDRMLSFLAVADQFKTVELSA